MEFKWLSVIEGIAFLNTVDSSNLDSLPLQSVSHTLKVAEIAPLKTAADSMKYWNRGRNPAFAS